MAIKSIRATAGTILIIELALTGASAPFSQTPQRGSIHGVVRVETTNIPLEGVEVRLAANSKSDNSETKLTDSTGQFIFENTATGNRRISILLTDGYFARISNTNYSSSVSETVVVASGKVTEVAKSVVPGGSISGRVYDPEGHAVPNASVWLLQLVYRGGIEALVPLHDTDTTNENGEFRFLETQPGRFYVSVDPDRSDTPTVDPLTGVETGMVRTFFPDATEWKQSTLVTALPGEAISNADIHLRKGVRGVSITGRIVNPFSKPHSSAVVEPDKREGEIIIHTRSGSPDTSASGDTTIRIIPHDRSQYSFDGLMSLDDDGTFEVDVSPGTYDLIALSVDDSRTNAADCIVRECRAFVYGMATVEVRDRDIEGVRLYMVREFELRGRILLDGSAFKSNSGVQIRLQPESGPLYGLGSGTINAVIEPDGTFRIASVTDGHYRFQLQLGTAADSAFDNVYIADILSGTRSVYDSGIEIHNGVVDPATVFLKTNPGAISGTLVDAAKKPVSGKVVLVPALEHRLNPALYQTVQSDGSGRFTVNHITPGNYSVFAWEWSPASAEQNTEYLRQFEAKGVPVTINPGVTVDVHVTQIRLTP